MQEHCGLHKRLRGLCVACGPYFDCPSDVLLQVVWSGCYQLCCIAVLDADLEMFASQEGEIINKIVKRYQITKMRVIVLVVGLIREDEHTAGHQTRGRATVERSSEIRVGEPSCQLP